MKKKFYYSIWALIIGINAYYIYHFPLKYFNVEAWQKAFGPILLTHIVFGMIAILIGPLQFFPQIRKNRPRIHRISGRIYLLAILVGALSAIILAIFDRILLHRQLIFATGIIGLASAWLITSGMALWAVRQRNFAQHQEWMIRSYVVTCGFTTFRLIAIGLNSYLQIDGREMGDIMAWACWAVPLLLTEVVLQANKIRQAQSVANFS